MVLLIDVALASGGREALLANGRFLDFWGIEQEDLPDDMDCCTIELDLDNRCAALLCNGGADQPLPPSHLTL